MHLKSGDQVVVTAGNSRGKRGKILRVFPRLNRVIVEGVNLHVKHLRKTPANPQGGRVEVEMPLNASSVLLWSDKAGKGVRTRIKEEKGKKVRVGVPCGTKFD